MVGGSQPLAKTSWEDACTRPQLAGAENLKVFVSSVIGRFEYPISIRGSDIEGKNEA
jgi:hypothetical protein